MNETALAIDSGTAAGLALKTRGTGDENNGGPCRTIPHG